MDKKFMDFIDEDFFKQSDAFYSLFSNIKYDLLKRVLLKMQNDDFKLDRHIFAGISEDCAFSIINDEEINNDTLAYVLPVLSNKIKSYFFQNDSRALYLYDKLNIDDLIDAGVIFNDNILKKKEFFNLLKKDDIVEFRTTINKIEKSNNPIIIEERLEEYYDEIINSYDDNLGFFRDYMVILNNPGKYKFNNSYIFDYDVVSAFSSYLRQKDDGSYFYEDYDKLLMILKDISNKKLSEVIIDALFRDNIYNVWININEMIRYNDSLGDDNKVLDNEKETFYKMILDFYDFDNVEKVNLYKRLKNKNFSFVFYDDLRKTKDVAYDRIKQELINPILHPEYINAFSSEKYGVDVYDLRDKEYTMLVRTQGDFKEIGHYRRGCYSIISNENTQVFGEYDTSSFLYGYNSFENDMVLHMLESDSYSTKFKDESSRYVNRIMTAEQLVKANNSYSEIQLINTKSPDGKYNWIAKKPDFIVVFNCVQDKHVQESNRLGIPIVIISKKKLDKNDNFNIRIDTYVNNNLDGNEYRFRR